MPMCVVPAFEPLTPALRVSTRAVRERAIAIRALIVSMQGPQVWAESWSIAVDWEHTGLWFTAQGRLNSSHAFTLEATHNSRESSGRTHGGTDSWPSTCPG